MQGLEDVNYERENALIAQHTSNLTARRRFGGSGLTSFTDLIAHSVPYPRIKYFSLSGGDFLKNKSESLTEHVKSALSVDNHLLGL